MKIRVSGNNLMKTSIKETVHKLFLLTAAIVFLFPFYWMVTTALKTDGNVYVFPPRFFAIPVTFENFISIAPIFPFLTYFKNNMLACTLSAIGQTTCSALAAYAFTRIEWKGRRLFFTATLSTMMIPTAVFAIPWYILYWKLGLLGSLAPLWLPYWFQHPYIIFLLAQFFRGIPQSFSDAAIIDGNGHFGIFFRIVIPLSSPALLTAFLLHFIFLWKDLLIPLMYINDEKLFTFSIGLQTLLGGTVKPSFNEIMAAAFIASLPLVILFIAFRKSIFNGIAVTSDK
jgi:multiple sugar transport system permease protein